MKELTNLVSQCLFELNAVISQLKPISLSLLIRSWESTFWLYWWRCFSVHLLSSFGRLSRLPCCCLCSSNFRFGSKSVSKYVVHCQNIWQRLPTSHPIDILSYSKQSPSRWASQCVLVSAFFSYNCVVVFESSSSAVLVDCLDCHAAVSNLLAIAE